MPFSVQETIEALHVLANVGGRTFADPLDDIAEWHRNGLFVASERPIHRTFGSFVLDCDCGHCTAMLERLKYSAETHCDHTQLLDVTVIGDLGKRCVCMHCGAQVNEGVTSDYQP